MKSYLPNNLNLEEHLKDYPPTEIEYFHKDALIYVLGIITEIPAKSDRDNFKDGFVPLNAYILKKIVWNYKHYLDYLVSTGVLISDNHFIIGKKSKGFKFSKTYDGIVVPVEIHKPSLVRKKDRGINISERAQDVLPHLAKWYNNNLSIDVENSKKILEDVLNINHPTSKSKVIYNHCIPNIYQLADKNYHVHIGNSGWRLNSPFTRVKREIRGCITYEGKKLVAIDIGTSQPFLSLILLNPDFYNSPTENKIPIINNLYNLSYSLFLSPPLIPSLPTLMLQKLNKCINNQDVEDYVKLVLDGKLYEQIIQFVKSRSNISITRDEAKDVLYSIIYSSNYFIGQPEAVFKRAFRDRFPTVYEIFALVKRGDHARLAILLQRIESHIVLNLTCKRISIEKPDLPLFTIHDSVVTIQGHENYVKSIMEEVLVSCIGHKPRLKVECWG